HHLLDGRGDDLRGLLRLRLAARGLALHRRARHEHLVEQQDADRDRDRDQKVALVVHREGSGPAGAAPPSVSKSPARLINALWTSSSKAGQGRADVAARAMNT